MDDEQTVWDDFFCTLVGWTMHPGWLRDNAIEIKPTLEKCADQADKMLKIRNERTVLRIRGK